MKCTLTLLFALLCFSTSAQQALLKFESGSSQDVYITNIDSLYITTSAGRFSLTELQEVSFPSRRGRDEHLYFELSKAKVKVSFDKNLELVSLQPPPSQDEMAQLKRSLREFKKSQQLGTGLQLAGLMAGIVGIIFEEEAFIYAGMAASGTGLVLQLNAANKLP